MARLSLKGSSIRTSTGRAVGVIYSVGPTMMQAVTASMEFARSTTEENITSSVLDSLTSSSMKASASMELTGEALEGAAKAFTRYALQSTSADPTPQFQNTRPNLVEKPYGRNYRNKNGKYFGKRDRF